MPTMRNLIRKITPKHPLYIQILFTALAFLVMVITSYLFTSNIVHENLIQNTENVLTSVQDQIESDLLEPRITLGSFAQTVHNVLVRGHLDILQQYINDISNYRDINAGGQSISNISVLYGYFEAFPEGPVFMNSIDWNPPDNFNPKERPWYKYAIAANGNVVETPPFIDSVSGEIIFAYARCIYDQEGNRLGVVGLDVQINDIGKYVIETALARDGYGVLISEDFTILAHPNRKLAGMPMSYLSASLAACESDLRKGLDISERPVISYKGESSIAFFRKLPNGWYLGVVTPKGPYYQSVQNMAYILGILGAVLAAALIFVLIRVDKARKKSDTESRHKSAFLANMSHEIRTPMNAIIGMTTIGKSAAGSERKDYCFTKIEDASNHLLGVINNVLDMSKIEANKFELAPMEFIFERMLQRVVNVVSFRIEEKRQKFKVHIDRAIPQTLIGDDQRLAQVITNLLGNAIKFTPEEHSITLDTRLLKEKDNICTIQVSLTDTGIGISPEQIKRLFGSFQQAETSTTRKFGGTGLGLAISKSIVEMMGGEIWVRSEPGKGSTFAFTIQARRGTNKEGALAPHINWGNVRIMAVDDDPDILDYFKEIAQGFGINCDTAISGEAALKFVEQNGIHHIYFVDWKMPGMDGIQLATELKARTAADSVVIMISAAEWSTIVEEAKKAGVDKFLSKPLFPSAIADIISESLNLGWRQPEEEQIDITGLFAGRRILLAEDVDINREIVLTLLESSQLKIDCAENGAVAVRMFAEDPKKYDLILMDVQMPEMDGYDATRQIRALEAKLGVQLSERPQGVPIIAMTANVFREDVEQCIAAGMNEHIGKPLDFDEMVAILKKYLTR